MIKRIPLEEIDPNPWQPRQGEDPQHIEQLAMSIKTDGLMQIPSGREVNGRVQLAFGHSRLAAYKWLRDGLKALAADAPTEWDAMPLNVVVLSDEQMFQQAVAENVQRRDLNPVELARAMQRYADDFGKNSREIGTLFNVSDATVRGTVRLLDLPQNAQDKLAAGEITVNAARQLLAIGRVAADRVDDTIERIQEGTLPERAIESTMYSLAGQGKAVKMWASYDSGKPLGGHNLWPLNEISPKQIKSLAPLVIKGKVNINAAKKCLPDETLTAENRPQLEEWVRQLDGGLVDPAALIAQGADAEIVDRIAHLVNPPACTACPYYVRSQGDHYCTWKICHTRKKDAWLLLELQRVAKKLGMPILSEEEEKAGYITLDYWTDAHKALVESKDASLRVKPGSGWNISQFSGSSSVAVVTIDPKLVRDANKKKEKQASTQEAEEKKREQRIALRKAAHDFMGEVAAPVFSALLDPIDNLGFLMSMSHVDEDDFKELSDEQGMDLSRADKLRQCRIEILGEMIGHAIDWEEQYEGPVVIAKSLAHMATTWGLELPADWLEQAGKYLPEGVPAETEAE